MPICPYAHMFLQRHSCLQNNLQILDSLLQSALLLRYPQNNPKPKAYRRSITCSIPWSWPDAPPWYPLAEYRNPLGLQGLGGLRDDGIQPYHPWAHLHRAMDEYWRSIQSWNWHSFQHAQ